MKAKKALKRLNKVEALLSNIIDQFQGDKHGLYELLHSAKATVVRVKKTVNSQLSTRSVKKNPPVKTETSQQRHLTPKGRKRISLAAKKRWAVAKRKGVNAVTGRRLVKTA
jgi:hypothetical protein